MTGWKWPLCSEWDVSNSNTGEVEKLRSLPNVLGMFLFLCSQLCTNIFGILSSSRELFLWSRHSSLNRLVMNKCVAGDVHPGSLLSAPLSCCLLPCCPCQASTTSTPHPSSHETVFLSSWGDPGRWRVEGSGFSSDQPAIAAHRRSCGLQRVLISCFWHRGCWRCCLEEMEEEGWRVEGRGGVQAVERHNQERGLKGCSGVLLESRPILISHTGLRVAQHCLLAGNVLLKPERSLTVGKQSAASDKVYRFKEHCSVLSDFRVKILKSDIISLLFFYLFISLSCESLFFWLKENLLFYKYIHRAIW